MAPSASARRSVEAVAARMISADVGPPSSIVAAWMTQVAGMSPAVVSTASPSPIGALASDSRCTSGPPAREIAAATPPAWRSSVLAALAIASTSSRRDVGVGDLDHAGNKVPLLSHSSASLARSVEGDSALHGPLDSDTASGAENGSGDFGALVFAL